MTDYVSNIRDQTLEEARQLLNFDIPRKILLLSQTHLELFDQSPESYVTTLHNSSGDLNTSVNKQFIKVRDELKIHLNEILQWMITLNMCISLRVPKIEDGNNFGVRVQATMRKKIQLFEKDLEKKRKKLKKVHLLKALYLKRMYKYPNCGDLVEAIAHAERRAFWAVIQITRDVSQELFKLLHHVNLNWEKTIDPKEQKNRGLMYF